MENDEKTFPQGEQPEGCVPEQPAAEGSGVGHACHVLRLLRRALTLWRASDTWASGRS